VVPEVTRQESTLESEGKLDGGALIIIIQTSAYDMHLMNFVSNFQSLTAFIFFLLRYEYMNKNYTTVLTPVFYLKCYLRTTHRTEVPQGALL